MSITYRNVTKIEGPLIFVRHKHNVKIGTIVNIKTHLGDIKNGMVLKVNKDIACIEVFQGTDGLDIRTNVTFLDELFTIGISREMRGNIFDGQGKIISPTVAVSSSETNKFEIVPEVTRGINGSVINPVARGYPKEVIQTGISAIDGLNTLVRGQKLPIFSGQGLPHNKLAAQIVKQSKVTTNEPFLVIFVGIGILQDDAMFFQQKFKESGNLENVISFINLASDPTIERILVPRVALTTAEYFAFDLGMHVLVIMTDITNYCEALRELSSAKGEIPSRKGFPGYMYSDLASIYERAGKIRGKKGSITQIPIISMPNDDITHPIPDLTGYITDGLIVLSRDLHKSGIYPPIDILSSLSRLMKSGVGKGKTREDHYEIGNQMNVLYSKSLEILELKSLIGEESLTQTDKKILQFRYDFNNKFIKQSYDEEREIEETLNRCWKLISKLPRQEIHRISPEILKKYYNNPSILSDLN
ncbi:MAG: V-type ATP synthase subunit B [Promethearchaeota archaeon]